MGILNMPEAAGIDLFPILILAVLSELIARTDSNMNSKRPGEPPGAVRPPWSGPEEAAMAAGTLIDMETYPRRAHFEYFRAMRQPYVGITADVDITRLRDWIQEGETALLPDHPVCRCAGSQPGARAAPAHRGGGHSSI